MNLIVVYKYIIEIFVIWLVYVDFYQVVFCQQVCVGVFECCGMFSCRVFVYVGKNNQMFYICWDLEFFYKFVVDYCSGVDVINLIIGECCFDIFGNVDCC